MQSHVPPSKGERNAIIGYKPQYEIAAIKILQAIKARNLVSLKIADPEAGRVDDFQIISDNRIDAFQIKWSEYPSSITYNQFITEIKNNPCYISQLADGWKRLKNKYPRKKILIHFIHHNNPSVNDGRYIPCNNKPDPFHFAAFINQVWNKIHNSPRKSKNLICQEWEPALNKFYESSNLETIDEFFDFVKDCTLELGYNIPTFENLSDKDRIFTENEIDIISKKLFDLVADPSKTVEYSLQEFLKLLGWEGKNELINQHIFPIDEILYQKNHELYNKLENLIEKTNKGYLGLFGTPGSGKSTFLTQFLKNRSELVIKYYSYIPYSYEPINLRGESNIFFHDIIMQLDYEGFSSGGCVSSFDKEILQKRFYNQMKYLHEEYIKTNRKTIILIDGIDHISREQHPDHSLIIDLPIPESIPEGIIFIIGSQTDEILPSDIRFEIRNNRKIEMPFLNRQDVINIINSSSIKTQLTSNQIDLIYSISNGHPLSLIYLINRITEIDNGNEISEILSDTNSFSGNIEQQYESYFDQVKNEYDLFELLGLIARCKSEIDLNWFETWYNRKSIFELRKKFSHYFYKNNSNSWFFFHNSFRLFIINKTSEIEPGISDESKSTYYHKILAKQIASEKSASNHSWNEIYHLYYAKDYQKIIEICVPSYFREHFFNFRAIPEIKNDIILALNTAKELNNYHVFIRLMLIGCEYEQRENYLEDISYFPLLFKLLKNNQEICINHLIYENKLIVKPINGLKISKKLNSINFQFSKKLFDISEPYNVLISKETYQNSQRYSPELLLSWASSAPFFRSITEIIKLIRNCRQTNNIRSQNISEEEIINFQQELLFRVGITLIKRNKWEDLKIIDQEINKISSSFNSDYSFNLNIWSSDFCINNNEIKIGEYFLDKAMEIFGNIFTLPETKVFHLEKIIHVLYNYLIIKKDRSFVQNNLKSIQDPEDINPSQYSSSFHELVPYIQYNKIQFLLGAEYKLYEVIPSNENEKMFFLFKQHIRTISYISVMGDIKNNLSANKISALIEPILKFYNYNYIFAHEIKNSYFIHNCQKQFYIFLIHSVIKHKDGLHALYSFFDQEWNDRDNKIYWPSLVWESILKTLYVKGGDKKWCLQKIKFLEKSLLSRPDEYYETYQRIHAFFDYSKIWAQMDDPQIALQYLRKSFETSIGIGFRKDYQLNDWIKWLDIINKIDPNQREERTIYFIKTISVLHEYVEKRSDLYAAEDLISITFNWSPNKALILAEWFIDEDIMPYDYARNVYLLLLLKCSCNIPINEIIPYIEKILINTEIKNIYIQIIEYSIVRSNNDKLITSSNLIKHIINFVKNNHDSSIQSQWNLAIAEILNKLSIDPLKFDLNLFELKEVEKSQNKSYSFNEEKIPPELLHLPIDPQIFVEKISILKYQSTWKPIVKKVISSYSQEDLKVLLKIIKNNSYLGILIAKRFFDDNNFIEAKEAALLTIQNCEWGGYGYPLDDGQKIEAILLLSKIDIDLAKKVILDTLFNDLTRRFPYFISISLQLHEFIPEIISDDELIRKIWDEIFEYLKLLFSEYTLPNSIPYQFIEEIKNDNEQTAYHNYLEIF